MSQSDIMDAGRVLASIFVLLRGFLGCNGGCLERGAHLL